MARARCHVTSTISARTSTPSQPRTAPHGAGGYVGGRDHVALLAVGFVAMEPVTYATHRWVMHGPGRRLHRSHHAPRPGARWQANDLFPLGFALVVMAAMAVGFNVDGWGWLVPLCLGVTLYGVAYALVHDVYAHRRAPLLRRRHASLERLATCTRSTTGSAASRTGCWRRGAPPAARRGGGRDG